MKNVENDDFRQKIDVPLGGFCRNYESARETRAKIKVIDKSIPKPPPSCKIVYVTKSAQKKHFDENAEKNRCTQRLFLVVFAVLRPNRSFITKRSKCPKNTRFGLKRSQKRPKMTKNDVFVKNDGFRPVLYTVDAILRGF